MKNRVYKMKSENNILISINKGVEFMDYISIGRKIANGRNLKGLTQEELAEKINSNAGYISNIETGKKKPSLRMLINIVNILDISLDYLVMNELENKKFKDDIDIMELYKDVEKLSSKNKRLFYGISGDIVNRLMEE